MNHVQGAPVLIGSGGGGKGGGGGMTEDPDSLASRAYAQVVDLICEGEVEGLVGGMQGVLLDGTPLQNPDGSFNFSGVSFAFQPGTQGQNYIAGFSEVDTETTVGLLVKQQQPIIRTITNAAVNAVRVLVSVPQLTNQDTKTGDIHGYQFDLAIDVQTAGGGFVQRVYDTISGKCTSQYQRSYRIDLSGAGPWDIRLRRITADSTVSNITSAFLWTSYTEVIDAKLTYPNSALVALRVDSAQFQAIPQRAYHMRLLRVQVPSNYNPVTRVYTGSWDGTFKIAWTNNPAWCFYDLMTNARYGLGQYVSPSQVDKWTLYSIGQYCDQLVPDGFGNVEPRFSCNCYIQNYNDAFKVVSDLASCFRAMPYWSTGSVTLVQDSPSNPVALFTQANVLGGNFTYTGSSLKARHTVALVTWYNMLDMGKPYVEYVEDPDGIARYGVIQTQVTAFGCTSRGQAHRVGKWLLYSERMEAETVTFRTGLEGIPVRPGDVIKVADAMRAGQRMGGRVSGSDGANAITVDSDLVDGNGHAVLVTGASISVIAMDGTVRTGTVSAQNGRVLALASNQGLAQIMAGVQTQAIWVLETGQVAAQLFRVVQASEAERNQIEITGIAHNPSKYNAIEYGWALEVRSVSSLSAVPAPPTVVSISENLYLYQSNIFSQVTISWPTVEGALAYKVGYSKDGASWVFDTTPANDYEIRQADPGSYDVRVWSIGASEKTSPTYTEAVQQIYGKTLPPADVQGLTWGVDQNAGLKLAWAPNTDVDLYAYEVRKATAGTDWASATLLGQIKATAYTVGVQGFAGTYLVKAIDTQGNYSQNAASIVAVGVKLPAPAVTGQFSGPNYALTWTAVIGTLATDHYEIRTDTNFGQPGAVATIKGTGYSAKVNWAGPQTFYVAAVDIGGTAGLAASVTLNVIAPSLPVISAQVVDNNVLLKWTASTGTLPVDHYNVAKGATLATATAIGTINGTFDTIFETAPGSFSYWITPVDVAGNAGASATVTVYVNQPPDYVLRYDYTADFDGIIYDFTGATLQGFTASGATLAAGNGITVTSTTTDPQLIRTFSTIDDFAGCEYPRVRVAVTRLAGSGWQGQLFWQTTARASYSTSFMGTIAANPAIGAKTVMEYDLAGATGSADWMNGTISAIRLDLGTTASDVFRIDYVELVPFEQTNVYEDVDGALLMPVDTASTFQGHFEQGADTWAPNNAFSSTWGTVDATLVQGATDPNGGATAWTMTRTAVGNHYIYRAAPQAACAGLTYTASVWMKAGTLAGTVRLWLRDAGGTTIAVNTITPAATWTKYTVTGTAAANAVGAASVFIDPTVDTGTAGETLFLWADALMLGSTAAGWPSPNDQVAAGYPIEIQPGLTTATYVESIDYGTTLPATKVTVTPTFNIVAGAPQLSVTIQTSQDNVTWTTYANTTSVYVTQFRYAKYTVTVTGSGPDVLRLASINYRYDVKLKSDAGTVQCLSTDVNGTPVTFNVDFIAVTSINVNANTTSPVFTVYNFDGSPNPSGFTVMIFDKNGNRLAGQVSWSAKGV